MEVTTAASATLLPVATNVPVDDVTTWDPESAIIISGTGGERLAEEVAGLIGLPASSCAEVQHPGSECRVRLGTNVRGRDVFVVQSTCDPVNSNFIELSLILSACQRASARRVTAVVPYPVSYTHLTLPTILLV